MSAVSSDAVLSDDQEPIPTTDRLADSLTIGEHSQEPGNKLLCKDTATINYRHRISGLIKRFGSLSDFIRMAGVAALVISMGLFLIDGLDIVNDTQRFFSMLLLTGLLSAGGFLLAFVLREQRGARAFFGLALLSVPVNFTVLGALLYSVFQFDAMNGAYPAVAHWEIASVASFTTTILIALAALIPVTLFGVSVLAREGRAWLSIALLVSSALLVFPIRDAIWISPLVALLVIAQIAVVKRFGEHTISLKTPSGRFVQGLLFLPPAIMLCRTFWLYEFTALSGLMVALTAFAALRYFALRCDAAGFFVGVLNVLSSIAALSAAISAVMALPVFIHAAFWPLVFSAIFGALMFELETRIEKRDLAEFMGIGSSIIIAIVVLINQFDGNSAVGFISGFSIASVLILVALMQQFKEKLAIGLFILGGVVVLNAGGVIDFLTHAGWVGFAILGAMAIVLASLFERFGPMLSERVRLRLAGREQ